MLYLIDIIEFIECQTVNKKIEQKISEAEIRMLRWTSKITREYERIQIEVDFIVVNQN